MKKLLESSLFSSVTGDLSMKRFIAFVYMMSALIMVFVEMFTKFEVPYDLWVVVVGAGGSLMGISIFEYFGKISKKTPTTTPQEDEKEKDLLVD